METRYLKQVSSNISGKLMALCVFGPADAEVSLCNFYHDPNAATYRWRLNQGETDSSHANTGPDADHTTHIAVGLDAGMS